MMGYIGKVEIDKIYGIGIAETVSHYMHRDGMVAARLWQPEAQSSIS